MRSLALLMALALAGCSTTREDFAREPLLSPPGTGVYQYPPAISPAAFPAREPRVGNSLWTDSHAGLFRDARALAIGDIVTVIIEIKDRAELDNNSKRSRDAGVDVGADFDGSISGTTLGTLGTTLGLKGGTKTSGKGSVKRSEKIDLQVAAVVTEVLPNGNLFISGQQEVRVNFEVRILSIAGVIRPGDILPNNTIAYDRIAEARIS